MGTSEATSCDICSTTSPRMGRTRYKGSDLLELKLSNFEIGVFLWHVEEGIEARLSTSCKRLWHILSVSNTTTWKNDTHGIQEPTCWAAMGRVSREEGCVSTSVESFVWNPRLDVMLIESLLWMSSEHYEYYVVKHSCTLQLSLHLLVSTMAMECGYKPSQKCWLCLSSSDFEAERISALAAVRQPHAARIRSCSVCAWRVHPLKKISKSMPRMFSFGVHFKICSY